MVFFFSGKVCGNNSKALLKVCKLEKCKNLSDPEVEMMVMQVWEEGCSYRDIKSLISRLYGTAISLKLLHRIIGQVKKYVDAFHQREIQTDLKDTLEK